MWNSPDIKDHASEISDFKLTNMITKITASNKENQIGAYMPVNLGKYSAYVFPDISADRIMKEMNYLQYIADTFPMKEDASYKTPDICRVKYDNPALYPLALICNKLFTNMDFNATNLSKVLLINKSQFEELFINKRTDNAKTAKIPTDINQYISYEQKIKDAEKAVDEDLVEWLNVKIPTHDFNILKSCPILMDVVNEVGIDNVISYITKLKKYRRNQ